MSRPHLLKALLESLTSNDLAGWTILVSIEPSSVTYDMIDICQSTLAHHSHEISVNSKILGISAHPHQLLGRSSLEAPLSICI